VHIWLRQEEGEKCTKGFKKNARKKGMASGRPFFAGIHKLIAPDIGRQGFGNLPGSYRHLVANGQHRNIQNIGNLFIPHAVFLYHLKN
jgi:hypothetical protein